MTLFGRLARQALGASTRRVRPRLRQRYEQEPVATANPVVPDAPPLTRETAPEQRGARASQPTTAPRIVEIASPEDPAPVSQTGESGPAADRPGPRESGGDGSLGRPLISAETPERPTDAAGQLSAMPPLTEPAAAAPGPATWPTLPRPLLETTAPATPGASTAAPVPTVTGHPLAGPGREEAGPVARGSTAAAPDEVHVHIGRIEVTAVREAPPMTRRRPRGKAPMTLDEYLAKRGGT
jgi:hypothetical protein